MIPRKVFIRIAIACLPVILYLPARGGTPDSSAGAISRVVAMVSDTSLRRSILGLQSFGTRVSTGANRDQVARWVTDRFLNSGLTVVQQDSFLQSGLWQVNVVATIPGTLVPEREIIVGAHTDSYSIGGGDAPGADDNASGVAAILEIARVLMASEYRPATTLRFIGFAAEEVGLRGARSYASRARSAQRQIAAMLNFDMIAHHNRAQALDQFNLVWYEGAEWLARLDSGMARTHTPLTPVLTSTARSGSDSYAFFEQGFPAVFHYERGQNWAYHTALDIIDSLDLSYAAGIIRSGLATLLTLDARSITVEPVPPVPAGFALLPNFPNPFNGGTTIQFDVPAPANVRVEVLDLLGRRVALLTEGLRQPARHEVRWEPQQAAGVYFVRMAWEGGAAVRRLVHVR